MLKNKWSFGFPASQQASCWLQYLQPVVANIAVAAAAAARRLTNCLDSKSSKRSLFESGQTQIRVRIQFQFHFGS